MVLWLDWPSRMQHLSQNRLNILPCHSIHSVTMDLQAMEKFRLIKSLMIILSGLLPFPSKVNNSGLREIRTITKHRLALTYISDQTVLLMLCIRRSPALSQLHPMWGRLNHSYRPACAHFCKSV